MVSITKFSIRIGYLSRNRRAITWMPDFRYIQPYSYDKIAKGRSPVQSWKTFNCSLAKNKFKNTTILLSTL